MNKIATDIEQSKKLLELGLSPDSADMYWERDMNCLGVEAYNLIPAIRYSKKELKQLFEEFNNLVPAWSLSALLGLMPNFIMIKNEETQYEAYFYFNLFLGKYPWRWHAQYTGRDFVLEGNQNKHKTKTISNFVSENQLDVVYEMLVWVLENKKL